MLFLKSILCFAFLIAVNNSIAQQTSRTINVDYKKVSGELSQVYKFCVGAGRANEGLRADWQQQLTFIKKEIDFKYIRFHGLLNDDMRVYTEDKQGNSIYNWQYIDKLYDFLLSIKIKPFVELGFMPTDLASGTKTVFWWKGNVTPPKSYEKWAALIHALIKHWEERYGLSEISSWYYEVWNEPDLGGFFAGTQEDYFHLYDVTARTIKSISPALRVGGPATARNPWIRPFLEYCETNRTPLDFVSTHSYNTKSVLDEFGTGRRRLLASDYLPEAVKKARRIIDSTIFKNVELHYTEFNSSPSSRDPIHDTYQNAAWLLSTLKRTQSGVSSMSYWTFTDIFEEAGPGVTSFHGGFGLLNLQSIKKPSFYSYKFLSQLGKSELENSDADSWACKDKSGVQLLFWNASLPFGDTTVYDEIFFKKLQPAVSAGSVEVNVQHLPNGNYKLQMYKVGYKNNDPFTAYLEMGLPFNINKQQEAQLKNFSSGAAVLNQIIKVSSGSFRKKFDVLQNEIYFIKLTTI